MTKQLLLYLLHVALNFVNPAEYTAIPAEYTLHSVLVLVRHGDRVQITRDLGDAFHEVGSLRITSEKNKI